MDDTLETLGQTIADALAGAVTGHSVAHHELTVTASARDIVAVMRFLRDDPRCLFWSFIDVTAVDWPSRERRFDVVYHLLSPKQNVRIRVKIETDEATRCRRSSRCSRAPTGSSARPTISTASLFTGHPDMRRILTDYGFEGHPLRKDFPLTGFVEVRYDDELKRVVYDAGAAGAGIPQLRFPLALGGPELLPLPGDEKGQGRRAGRGRDMKPTPQARPDPSLSSTQVPENKTVPHTYPGVAADRRDAESVRHRLHDRADGMDLHRSSSRRISMPAKAASACMSMSAIWPRRRPE